MNSTLAERRKYFDGQKEYFDSKEFRFSCPCCGYPTLYQRGGYNICQICSWEDDNQDDFDADVVRGGPNFLYSLTEARANFKKYTVMYSPEKDKRISGTDIEKLCNLKQDLITAFDKIIEDPNFEEIAQLWQKVKEIKRALQQELMNKFNEYESKVKSEDPKVN